MRTPPPNQAVTPSGMTVSDSRPSGTMMISDAHPTRVSVSVALLLPGTGSATPPGGVTDAVLARVPVAAGSIVPVSVYVTEPPAGRLTVSLMVEAPAAVQVAPPAPTQVHVTPVSAAGGVSLTVDPGAASGPELAATIVYVTPWPGNAFVKPSVLAIERSADGAPNTTWTRPGEGPLGACEVSPPYVAVI